MTESEISAAVDVPPNLRIVLVEPSHPGNIGGTARAMKTMGLENLVLVNPKRYPDPQAQWRAAGAQDVLENAQVVTGLTQAIGDCHRVIGTSTRVRRIPWPLQSVEEVAIAVAAQSPNEKTAILFGREDNGLSNEELQQCHVHLQIPANAEYSSLNLAMAVQVVCYELYKQRISPLSELVSETSDQPNEVPATQAAMDRLMEHLEAVLVAGDFLDPANPGQTLTRLRRLFVRAKPDDNEMQILRGMLKHLDPRR